MNAETEWRQNQNYVSMLELRENVKWSLSNLASTINDAHLWCFDRKLINTELEWNNCENDFQIYISNDSKNLNLVFDLVFQYCAVKKENESGYKFDGACEFLVGIGAHLAIN